MKNLSLTRKFIISLFFGFLVVAVFLLTYSVNVFAASDQTYFPMEKNHNNKFTSSDVSKLETYFDAENYYYIALYHHTNSSGTKFFRFAYIPKDTSTVFIGTINSNGYQFTLSKNGSSNARTGTVTINTSGQVSLSGSLGTNYWGDFTNVNSNIYDSSIDYYSNFNLFTSTDQTRAVLLSVPFISLPETSDPTVPDLSGLDLDSSLNTSSVPTAPTYNNTFNTPLPTYDPSSPIESLVNVVVWGFNRIHSFWQSFIDYLSGWLTYFINIFTYLIQKIINAIKYFITWIYNQFLSWLNPYLKILALIFTFLFDDENQLSLIDLVTEIKDNLSTHFGGLFSNSFFTGFWNNFDDSIQYFRNVVLFFASLIAIGTDPTTHEFTFIGLITGLLVPDVDAVNALIIANDELDLIGTGKTLMSSFPATMHVLMSVSPSPTFHVPSCTFHGLEIGDFDISFSWFNDYKLYYDIILNGFLIIGWIYWVCVTFSHHMKGTLVVSDTSDSDKHFGF